jgi:hypothetical protein
MASLGGGFAGFDLRQDTCCSGRARHCAAEASYHLTGFADLLKHLAQTHTPRSVAIQIEMLYGATRVMMPDADWSWLKVMKARLRSAALLRLADREQPLYEGGSWALGSFTPNFSSETQVSHRAVYKTLSTANSLMRLMGWSRHGEPRAAKTLSLGAEVVA